jgi:hypothetical protein
MKRKIQSSRGQHNDYLTTPLTQGCKSATALFDKLPAEQRKLISHILIHAFPQKSLEVINGFHGCMVKRRALAKAVRHQAAKGGFPFRLENGLNARLYSLNNPRVEKIADLLCNSSCARVNRSDRKSYGLIKVVVAKSPIYLLSCSMRRTKFHDMLAGQLDCVLSGLDALIYKGKVYRGYTDEAGVLQTAIRKKTSIPIAKMVFSE